MRFRRNTTVCAGGILFSLLIVLPLLLSGCGALPALPAGASSVTEKESAPERADGKVSVTYTVGTSGGGRLEGWTSQHGMPGETAKVAVTAVPLYGYAFSAWSDGSTEPTRQDVYGEEDTHYTAYFTLDCAELPVICITTETGRDVTSKTSYIGAEISVCNTGDEALELGGAQAQIRGRGNATWNYDKKSYRIRFDEKQQLLGLGTGPSRAWVLMANHCDQSMLRNYLGIYMANRLDGIGFNSSAAFAEVYLNGEYRGVYLVAEQVQEGEFRIDLGRGALDDLHAADIGFVAELDMYAEGEYSFDVGGHPYELKSDVYNDAQYRYAIRFIEDVDAAIRTGDRQKIGAVFDLDSAVDGYLLEEFFKNIDVGWSSLYMYKLPGEGEVLHLGSFWDFDLAAGNDHRLDNGDYKGIYVGKDRGFSQGNMWFIRLCRQPWFMELVRARFEEILPIIDETIEECRRAAEASDRAFRRNFDVWKIFGMRINKEPEQVMALRSYEGHLDYLIRWMENRRDWLKEYFESSF